MTPRMIVVTGGTGFIGSNIVARLTAETAYDVVVCDRLETADLAKWKNVAKHAIADFWSPEDLFEQLERHAERIEAVVHMGAISSTTEPDADLILRTNFILSRDLWDWCTIRDARMIYASSAATYGDGDAGFNDDDDAESLSKLRPLNAYGYSKMLFDQHAVRQSDRGQAPRQWAGLKFFNVYGPNEGHKGGMKSVVAQIWPKVEAGETVSLFRSHNPNYPDVANCATSSMWTTSWISSSSCCSRRRCLASSTLGPVRHGRSTIWPRPPPPLPGRKPPSSMSTCPR